MKNKIYFATIVLIFCACTAPAQKLKPTAKTTAFLQGTWKLLSGATIEKTDTSITDYTKDKAFIKIINNTHFAFLSHDLIKGKDSAAALFSAGGGTYTLVNNVYTEHLQYCSDRQWEGNTFTFTVAVHGDTLIQQGIEKIENLGVNRINIEKYVRIK